MKRNRYIPAKPRSKELQNQGGGVSVKVGGSSSSGSSDNIPAHTHEISDTNQLKTELDRRLLKAVFDDNFSVSEALVEVLKNWKVNGDATITGKLYAMGGAAYSRDAIQLPFAAGGSEYLNDLLDVTITNPLINQHLKYNGTNWVNASISYNDLIDKPSIPNVPSWALQASKPSYGWSEIGSKPASFPPSAHGHSISDVSGLQSALDGKSPTHTHPYRPNTWVPAWGDVTGKPSTFPPSSHSHASIDNSGRKEPESGANRPSIAGLSMHEAYSAAWPMMYGNVLTLRGGGDNQIFFGWSGTSGAHADAYIRSRRDVGDAQWSGFAKLWTNANSGNYSADWYCKAMHIGGQATSRITSENGSHLHYYTDASDSHWFNKTVRVNGEIYAGSGHYSSLVWNAGNSNLSTVDWTCRNSTVHGKLVAYGGAAYSRDAITVNAASVQTYESPANYTLEQQQEALLMMSAEITKLRDRVAELEKGGTNG